jgi:hypothetical protein
VFADFDGDGDLDLYVCNRNGANELLINDGKGSFTDEAAQRGVDSGSSSVMAAVFDADGDGDLDMYVGNYHVNVKPKLPEELAKKYEGKLQFPIKPDGTLDLPADLAQYAEGDSAV